MTGSAAAGCEGMIGEETARGTTDNLVDRCSFCAANVFVERGAGFVRLVETSFMNCSSAGGLETDSGVMAALRREAFACDNGASNSAGGGVDDVGVGADEVCACKDKC